MKFRIGFGLRMGLTIALMVLLAQTAQPATSAPGFVIGGVMVNAANGQPVAGAKVVIAPVMARSSIQMQLTGADGRFAFAGLSAGKYSIEGSARGYREQGWNQHDNYATAVVVGRDLDASNIVFRLQPDASIEGRVTDEDNEPVENASVRLFTIDNEEGQHKAVHRETTETNDQGYYHLGHLAPGTYYLAVAARPWYAQNYLQPSLAGADPDMSARSAQEASQLDRAYPLTFYPDALDSTSAGAILLHQGERITADVSLQSVKAVRLRILDPGAKASGGPAFQINLKQRIFDHFEPVVQGVSMSASERDSVEVFGLAPGHYLVEARANNRAGRGWYQEVDLAGDTDLTAAAGPGFADVSGIVRFEGSTPSRGRVFLMIQNRDTGESFSAPILPDGQFSFHEDRMRPGTYSVTLGNSEGFALQKMAATGATITGRTLEVTAPNTVHLAAIASHGIGQVKGIAQRDSQGVAGAMIVLVPKDPAYNQPLFRRDQSDSDGTFNLPNVVPGSYTVLAIANGWELDWADPRVLQPYMKSGVPVQVIGEGTADVKVPVQ